MNATATVDPATPQHILALQRANEIRLARAGLKREIAIGAVDIAQVILSCPTEAESMPLADLLMSQRRWGETKSRKFLRQVSLSEKKTIGSLTERQRKTLVAMLFAIGATKTSPRSV